jgi:hypothetical protein
MRWGFSPQGAASSRPSPNSNIRAKFSNGTLSNAKRRRFFADQTNKKQILFWPISFPFEPVYYNLLIGKIFYRE